MSGHDTDEARDFRRDRIRVIKPAPAEESLPELEFRAKYMSYHYVSRDKMADVEESRHHMYCPACQTPFNASMVKARILRITIEEDLLRNFPAIAHACCNGCGWEEMIPITAPDVSDEDRILARRFGHAVSKSAGGNRLINHTPWNTAICDKYMYEYMHESPLTGPSQIHKNADVWDSIAAQESILRDAEACRTQLPYVEEVEKQERERSAAHQSQKQAQKVDSDIFSQFVAAKNPAPEPPKNPFKGWFVK
jgi:hypothetical protein